MTAQTPTLKTHKKMGLDILPYRILVRHWSPKERMRLNQALYDSGHAEASRILHESLGAREEPVRLFAAQALEFISTRRFAAIESLRAALRKTPNDASLRLEIADRLKEYAEEGVFVDSIRHHFFREAAEHLSLALAKSPEAPAFLFRLGELHFLLGENAAAAEPLEKILPDADEYPRARWLLAEIAFKEGRIDAVRAECARLSGFAMPPEIHRAVQHWKAQ